MVRPIRFELFEKEVQRALTEFQSRPASRVLLRGKILDSLEVPLCTGAQI